MKIVLGQNLLYISIISAVLIVLLFAVRSIFGRKIHRIFFSLEWTVVLLRLIIPFCVTIPVSGADRLTAVFEFLGKLPFMDYVWIWFTGACIAASVFVVHYIFCGRVLREALPLQKVPGMDEEMFTFMGIHVYVSDRISSPITFGIFHQKVLLPKYYMKLSREQLKYILIHEKNHMNGHDNFKKFLVILAVCIHWFNPFAWLMYVCCNRDMELACDEKVIRQTGESCREEYANALISLASEEMLTQSVYSGFSGSAIRERVIRIMGYQKVKSKDYAAGVIVALLSMMVFAIPVKPETVQPVQEPVVYDAVEVVEILEEDSSGSKVNVTARTREGVKLCFRIFPRKGFACTNGAVFTPYLPEGEKWRAGMDSKYRGIVTVPEAVEYKGKQYPVKGIGPYTFFQCEYVKEIILPDTVREIKDKAFYKCRSIRKISLPVELELMSTNPFMGCDSLEAFEMNGPSQGQYQVKDGILYTDYGRFLKVYPQGRKKRKVVIDDTVTQIASCAFYGAGMRKVKLPKSMIRVKSRCFQNCRILTEVEVYRKTQLADDIFTGAGWAQIQRYD